MINTKHLLSIILLFIATLSFAQKGENVVDKQSGWQDRIYVGGGFGLSGGSGGGSVSLSPLVGYMITSRLSGGVGATYQYYKFGDFSDNRYGGQVFLRMNTIRRIFLYTSYEFFNYSTGAFFEGPRRTVTRLPVGAGMSQPMGSRASLNFLAAYDVLWDQTAYSSPWIFTIFFSI